MAKSSNARWRGFMNWFAFVALMFIGVSLFISALFDGGNDIRRALETLAQIMAIIVVAFYAFIYAHKKWGQKQIWFIIAWTIAVVLVVLFYILR